MSERIKVLHLYTALDDGGVERFLLNYYDNMDRSRIQFDVVVPGKHKGILEDTFIEHGSVIYHVPTLHSNFRKHISSVYQIMREGNYDVVHCHGYKSCLGLVLAWLTGVKVRIIHSHMAYENESAVGKIRRKIATFICKTLSTERFACGEAAGIWLYGQKDYDKKKFKVIHNAIDVDKFAFNVQKRKQLREDLGLGEGIVIGNVGRFSYQKNQEFLIPVLTEILEKRSDARLVFVGDGESIDEIKKLAQTYQVEENVLFLGARGDVHELLSAFDVFVLPSRYEGLPVSLVEAQASGLYGCVADTITQEVNITGMLEYISLEQSAKYWAERIVAQAEQTRISNRECRLINGQYDIKEQAKRFQKKYEEIVRR